MVEESLISTSAPPGADPPAPENLPDETSTSNPENGTAVLQQELSELKKAFADIVQHRIPEFERVRSELEETAAERDNAASELQQLKRENALEALAEKNSFNDVEYLDFLLQKNQIEPTDSERCAEFMKQFRQKHPRYFAVPVKPGAGSRPGNRPVISVHSPGRMEAVEMMLSAAPEIY